MGGVDAGGADEPVAATDVPRLEGLLVRVPPRARQEQLETDRPPAAGATRFLGEVDEGVPDAGPAVRRGGREHAELARVRGDVAKADGAGELAASRGDRDLAGGD